MHSGQRFISVELCRQPVSGRAKVFRVLWRPPIQQSPVRVELAALIVKAVTDFVSNHGADAAVVLHIVGVRVEEWWVQDSRRKIQAVLDGDIQRVNGLGS